MSKKTQTQTGQGESREEFEHDQTGIQSSSPSEETTDPQSLLARIQTLEARLDLVVRCNCLRESER